MQPLVSGRAPGRGRRVLQLLTGVVLLALAVPVDAADLACKPARWREEFRTAFRVAQGERCPDIDEGMTNLVNRTAFVAWCGETVLCGKRYATIRANGRTTLVPAGEIERLPFVYPGQVPTRVEDGITEACHLATTGPSGADFYALGPLQGGVTPVEAVRRLRPETPLAACRRTGDFVFAWLRGQPGLVPRSDLTLSNQREPEAYFRDDGPFCLRPTWQATALRPTVLYMPRKGEGKHDEHAVVDQDEHVEILSAHRGGDGRGLWYYAGHAAVRGFVRAEDLRVEPTVALTRPAVPVSGCPLLAELARTRRTVTVTPLRWLEAGRKARVPEQLTLPAGLELPVAWTRNGPEVLVFGVAARLSDAGALLPPHRKAPLVFERAALAATVSTDGCDQLATFTALPDGVPEAGGDRVVQGPEPVEPSREVTLVTHPRTAGTTGPVRVDRLVELQQSGHGREQLRQAVAGSRPVVTPLRHEVETALQPGAPPPPKRHPAAHGVLARVNALEYEAGHLLLHGNPAAALQLLLPCLGTTCDTGAARYLAADALARLGFTAIAAELLLDLLEEGEGPLDQALHSYRGVAKRFAPSPRAVAVLLPWCDGTRGRDAESCFLGLQAAMEVEDLAGALPHAAALRRLQPDARQQAVLALFDTAVAAGLEDGALRYADAVRQACTTCPQGSELAQALLLQTARAAWEVGDVDAAARAVVGLVPRVAEANGDLVATVLFAAERPAEARSWLERVEARTGSTRPELTVWRARLLVDECRLADAVQAVTLARQRSAPLVRVAAPVQRAVVDVPGALTALRNLDATLRRLRAPSRTVTELDRVLRPTGACGQWRELVRQRDGLCRALACRAPGHARTLPARLDQRIAEADGRCLMDLQLAAEALIERAGTVEQMRAELRVDIMETRMLQLDRAQHVLGAVQEATLARLGDDVAAQGPGSTWAARLEALHDEGSLPVQPVLAAALREGTQQVASQRNLAGRLAQLFEECGRDGPEAPTGQNPGVDAVDGEVRRALRCLARLARGGASPETLPLLYRYLPAIELLTPDLLRSMQGELRLHPEVWQTLTGFARRNGDRPGMCLPEGGHLPLRTAERPTGDRPAQEVPKDAQVSTR